MESILTSIKESYNELANKVTWPTFPNLLNSTVVVLVASVIIAFVIFLMDGISRKILEMIYNLGT